MSNIFDLFRRVEKKTHTGKIEYLIAGLGNPGMQYEKTRHNAGFMAIDQIAKAYGTEVKTLKWKSLTGEAIIAEKRCLLMKPETYMNNSGEAVISAYNFYKLTPDKLIVFCDDTTLKTGTLRLRRKGSPGGHNGIKDITEVLDTQEFTRIKIGVGQKPHPDYDLADWVLSKFTTDEQKLIDDAAVKCSEITELIIRGKTDEAMNKFNK